jgi:hypothetical protein
MALVPERVDAKFSARDAEIIAGDAKVTESRSSQKKQHNLKSYCRSSAALLIIRWARKKNLLQKKFLVRKNFSRIVSENEIGSVFFVFLCVFSARPFAVLAGQSSHYN